MDGAAVFQSPESFCAVSEKGQTPKGRVMKKNYFGILCARAAAAFGFRFFIG